MIIPIYLGYLDLIEKKKRTKDKVWRQRWRSGAASKRRRSRRFDSRFWSAVFWHILNRLSFLNDYFKSREMSECCMFTVTGRLSSCVSLPRHSRDSRGSTGRSQSTAPRRSWSRAGECTALPPPLELVFNFCFLALFTTAFVLTYTLVVESEAVVGLSVEVYAFVVLVVSFVVEVWIGATVNSNGFTLGFVSCLKAVVGASELELALISSLAAKVTSQKQAPANESISATAVSKERDVLELRLIFLAVQLILLLSILVIVILYVLANIWHNFNGKWNLVFSCQQTKNMWIQFQ